MIEWLNEAYMKIEVKLQVTKMHEKSLETVPVWEVFECRQLLAVYRAAPREEPTVSFDC